jgi:TATA-box binding protein (TBP) (component of TFIID and TFIIIB)
MELPILTTMVVLYNTGVKLDTENLVQNLPLTENLIKIEKQGVLKRGSSSKDKIRHRKTENATPRKTTGFGHNSITIVLLSDGDGTLRKKEITIKIFQNGVFHITGVLDEKYDRDVVTYLKNHISENCPTAVTGEWDLTARRVVLMNYKTNIKGVSNLSRETLYSNMRKRGIRTNYEPAVYPAVKIYFTGTKWIAKVFRTGNVILTGMTTAEECSELKTRLEEVLVQGLA